MKNTKAKAQKKSDKKAAKKQLEQSLTEKFLDVVKALGHNAESIGEEIAKASKSVAKKLSKKLDSVKEVVTEKLEKVTEEGRAGKKASRAAKTEVDTVAEKVETSVKKFVRKTVSAKRPVSQSVRVTAIGDEGTAKKAIKGSKTAVIDVPAADAIDNPVPLPVEKKPAGSRTPSARKPAKAGAAPKAAPVAGATNDVAETTKARGAGRKRATTTKK